MLQVFKKATAEALAEILAEMEIRRTTEIFLLFEMGSQTTQLIYQQLAKLGVYCLVADPASVTADDVSKLGPIGIIVSGGPASVHCEPPPFDRKIFDLGIPTLGICLGFQMWAQHIGLNVVPSDKKEFGVHEMEITAPTPLFADCPPVMNVLQSHGDRVEPGLQIEILATTKNSVAAASYGSLIGVQFHPEVTHTEYGTTIFQNFCFGICTAKDRFPAQMIAKQKIDELKRQIGEKKVLLALSGGSDSSVVAYLLSQAAKREQIRAVYIRGIDRPDDEQFTRKFFGSSMDLVVVDATDRFLEALAGKIDMHEKRVAMRSVYRAVLEEQIASFGADFIAQGTLYTDLCESGGGHESGARKAQIKLHHNINLGFSIPEIAPLDDCVKDGARGVGRDIGVPEELLIRHPFPGPGLVVRIEGEVTREKLVIARHVDGIWISELRTAGLYEEVWQAGAVVTLSRHTCSKGDDAGNGAVVALWAVSSVNGFTARAACLPYDFLERADQRIMNEVPGVGTTMYRLSSKPPSTIEWG